MICQIQEKKFRFLLLLCLSLFGSAALSGESCKPVDLRSCLGQSRDQGETGWCFATTTADLASCVLGERVSATDIALSYHLAAPDSLDRQKNFLEGISQNPDLNSRFNDWQRREYPFAESFRIGKNGNLPDYKGLYAEGGEEDIAFMVAANRGFCLDAKLPSGPLFDVKNIQEAKKHSAKSFSMTPELEFGHVPSSSRRVAQAFWSWGDARCGARLKPRQFMMPKTFSIASDSLELKKLRKNSKNFQKLRSQLLNQIDLHLDAGRPVASGMDTRDMTTPEWSGEDPEHSIIFAGRKLIAGSCHYFVRNTGGSDCSIYLSQLSPKTLCDAAAGGIWVRMEQIPSLYSSTAIEVR